MSRITLTQPTTVNHTDDRSWLDEQSRMVAYELVENARGTDEDLKFFQKCEALYDVTSRISAIAETGDRTGSEIYNRTNYVTKTVLRELNSLLKGEEKFRGMQAAFDLAKEIQSMYFSASPNISALASSIHIIPEVALLCQNPVVQATFGPNMVGNISYSLHYSSADRAFECGKSAAAILDQSAHSFAEKLDMVAQLKTIVAESNNTTSRFTPEFAEGIIDGLSELDRRPILGYALSSLQQFISRERIEPSLPLGRPQTGAYEYARSDVVTDQEIARDRILRSQLVLDVPGRPQRIAKDAFVMVDQSNTGNYLCLVPNEVALPEPSYDAYMLSLLKDEFEHTKPSGLLNTLLNISNGRKSNLLTLGSNCIGLTSQESLTVLLKDSPETLKLVTDYLECFHEVHAAQSNLEEAIYQGLNRGILEMFFNNPDDLTLSPEGSVFDEINEKAHIWVNNPTQENLETAATAIKSNLSRQRLHAIAYRLQEEIEFEVGEDLKTISQAANDTLVSKMKLIEQTASQIIADIVSGVENLEREVRQSNLKPEVLRYDQLFERPDIFPFHSRDPESDALLLRHLHNPTIRIPLEHDLGIELSSIPLRTQLHFLRALSSHDDTEFNRLQGQLKNLNESERKLLVQCYLVAAEEPELGKYVLTVAEGIDDAHKVKIFEAYFNLVQESDLLATSLMETSDALGINSGDIEERRIEIQKRMLQRANTLFGSFVRQDRKDWDSLADFFESESAEITTMAGTFATLKEYLQDKNGLVDLERIPGVVVSVKEAGDLSEEHKAQMHAAYKRSLLTYPPGFRPLAYGEFCQTLEAESRSRFHTLTYHDKIVSFLRMDPTPEGYYMASVNTSALANGFGIGTPWLKGVLDLYADQNISLAYVEGNEQIARLYQNLGFGPAGSVENAGNSGTKVYKMTNSFSMKPDFMGEFLVLEVGFNMNVRTTGDKVLKDAMAGLHGLDLGSGSIIGINGRCSLLAAAAMSQNLKERFDTVAFWNPTLSTYLVGVSENPEVPPGSLISTDGIVSSPAAGIGDSYLIKRVNDSSDGATILSIGFNPEIGADPGQVLVDAIAALDKVDLKGGKLVKLNGMASLPIIASLTDRLSRNYDAIAVYDPKIPGDEKYVITHTKTREYTFGEKIP